MRTFVLILLALFYLSIGILAALDAEASTDVVGVIEIPSIGVKRSINSGSYLESLEAGVAHWSHTPFPGEAGNIVLGGHRTVGTAPFYYLANLRQGDRVIIHNHSGRNSKDVYLVSEVKVYERPHEPNLDEQNGEDKLTLIACHPLGESTHRLVVMAQKAKHPQ